VRRAEGTSPGSAYRPGFGELLGLIRLRLSELLAHRDARTDVEGRYLAGHEALFPELGAAFDAQMTRSQALAQVATDLADNEGVQPSDMPGPELVGTGAADVANDLVQQAHADALQKLGESDRVLRIGTEWVRAKLAPAAEEPPEA
jgi:hypothetical protein